MEAHALEAYGLCGLTPETFGALTVPEFEDILEAKCWQESRWMRILAQIVAQLIRPHLSDEFNPTFYVDDLLNGDPVEQIEEARAKRLVKRKRARELLESE